MKTAAASTLAGLGAATVAVGQDALPEEIELGGQTSGWIGQSPEEIADERNPTLRLLEGQEYVLTWENLDGIGHNFIIEDEDGENIVETDIISGSGETQTVEFTATAEMHEYYCAPHPTSMRGDVEVVDDEPEPEEPVDEVETVVAIPDDPTPENLAIDDEGALYFSIVDGEVRRLTPEQTLETGLMLEDVEQVGELPGEAFGVEVVPDGTLFVTLQAGEETGVWRVPPVDEVEPDDDEMMDDEMMDDEMMDDEMMDDEMMDDEIEDVPEGEPFAIIGVEDEVFPNGIEYDEAYDRLLFTESFGGAVYEVPLDADDPDEAASVWFEDDRLDTETFGANGLNIVDDYVYVAVTEDIVDEDDAGRILRVPVEEDGEAGEGETFVEGPEVLGADGIEMGPEEYLYVAAIFQDAVVRVDPDGEVETVASAEDGLVFPSDVTFGTTDEQEGELFICNFAPEEPEESAILRLGTEEVVDEVDDEDEE
ncbi:plastocyanin/azurin family copper-binding protein [Natrialbaceae archaeon A-gly3]